MAGWTVQAQIRGFGIYTCVEIFNDVLQEVEQQAAKDMSGEIATESTPDTGQARRLISEEGKIQIARAIGVGIVKNGSMYPTMELHLRHAIAYLKLGGKQCTQQPGILDNETDLIHWVSAESGLPARERTAALCIYLLNCCLDGDMGLLQMDLWKRLCTSAHDIAVFEPARIRAWSTRFRAFDMMTAEDLRDCFDPSSDIDVPSACNYQYLSFKLQSLLTC